MTVKPILFSGPMVRAMLEGHKTMTRRVLPLKALRPYHVPTSELVDYYGYGRLGAVQARADGTRTTYVIPLSHAPGDLLYVRETWSGHYVFRSTPPAQRESFAADGMPYLREEIWYWADGQPFSGDWEKPRTPLHMPRWASRLTLEVTEVRVERVQDISEDDGRAEGVNGGCWTCGEEDPCGCSKPRPDHRESFINLWDTLNAKRGFGWDANPWVSVTAFKVHKGNVDALPLFEGGR